MAADGDVTGPPHGLRQPESSASPCGAKPKAGGKKHALKEKLVQHTSVTPAAVCTPILAEEPAVLSLVFSILPATALGRALCVCKSWNAYAKDESLWRKLCVEKWPSTGTTGIGHAKSPFIIERNQLALQGYEYLVKASICGQQ